MQRLDLSEDEDLRSKDSHYPSLSLTTSPAKQKTTQESPSVQKMESYFCENIISFALISSVSYETLKDKGKICNLVVIQSGRTSGKDRVGFGLKAKVRKILKLPRVSLFYFAKHQDGLYTHGATNDHYWIVV